MLGAMPKERAELQLKTVDEVSFAGYVRRRINYFVDDWHRTSAWLFLPEGKDEVPAILCCHQRVPQGKNEPAGIEGDPRLAFAQRYAELGYATLAVDCLAAGERVYYKLEPYDTSAFHKDNPKLSALGKMLIDHAQALDALSESRRVDMERLGVIGHGMGAYNALFLAAFDERIRACVASCGFTRFADDKTPERWVEDEGFAVLPKLKDAVDKREFPFDWEHILALGAPIPTLLLTALNDPSLANTKSCDKAAKLAGGIYGLLGAEEALCNRTHREGHTLTPELLECADEWFERWL